MTKFGVGEWRTADGSKAVVTEIDYDDDYPLRGEIYGIGKSWTEDGRYVKFEENERDLIGPWPEPAPTPPAEQPIGKRTVTHTVRLEPDELFDVLAKAVGAPRNANFAFDDEQVEMLVSRVEISWTEEAK